MSIRVNFQVTNESEIRTFYINPDITYQQLRHVTGCLIGHDEFLLTFLYLSPDGHTIPYTLQSEPELAVFLSLSACLGNVLKLTAVNVNNRSHVPAVREEVKPATKHAASNGGRGFLRFLPPQNLAPLHTAFSGFPPAPGETFMGYSNSHGTYGSYLRGPDSGPSSHPFQPSSGQLNQPSSIPFGPSTTASSANAGAGVIPSRLPPPEWYKPQSTPMSGPYPFPDAASGYNGRGGSSDGQMASPVVNQRGNTGPGTVQQAANPKNVSGGKLFAPLIDEIVAHIKDTMEEAIKDAVDAVIKDAMDYIEDHIRCAIEDAKNDM